MRSSRSKIAVMTDYFPVENFIVNDSSAADVVNIEKPFRVLVTHIGNQPDVSHSPAVQIPRDDIAGFVIHNVPRDG